MPKRFAWLGQSGARPPLHSIALPHDRYAASTLGRFLLRVAASTLRRPGTRRLWCSAITLVLVAVPLCSYAPALFSLLL